MVRRFSFQLNRRLSALTRRRVGLSLQDGELWAGGMLRPAGFSAGRGACARGGCSARRCFALARRNDIPLYRIVNCAAARLLCLPDIVPAQGYRARGAVRRGDVVLSVCFAFGSCRACVPLEMSRVRFAPVIRSSRNVLCSITPGVRSCWNVLRSVHAGHTFLSVCLAFDHACCLPPVRQTGRLAGCFVPVPPWVVIAIRAFSDVVRLSNLAGSLRVCAFLYGDPDRERRRRRERGGRGNGIGGAAECAFA